MNQTARPHTVLRHLLPLALILLIAALFRVWLIETDAVSFDSDEAIVGLMARHVNQGQPVPTFYYGQDYMGSLDALLVAGGFQLMGASVHSIRYTQLALYLLALVTAYALAWELTRSRHIALLTVLLLAIPTSLGVLYTTLTLGGYNEIVILGNLILLLGWQVTLGQRDGDLWRWAALGLVMGVGWWVNGAIVTVCLAVGVSGLRRASIKHWRAYALAGLAFLLGSSPWWLHNFQHDWQALKFLTGGFGSVPGQEPVSPLEGAAGLLILGFPAIYGLRHPWAGGYTLTLGLALAGLVYLLLATEMFTDLYARARYRRRDRQAATPTPQEHTRRWLWSVFGAFTLIFVFSSFSDSTGRYLMPVWVPAALGVALGLERLRRAGWMLAAVALGVLLTFQAAFVIVAAQTEKGLQPQLVGRLQTPAQYDAPLLDFLATEGYTHGYASYWSTYRLVFRSGETLILDTALPHDESGFKPGGNRYPPYREQVEAAEQVVWITQAFPELDAQIENRLAHAEITYRTHDFGPYRIYYAFSEQVAPADLDLNQERPLEEWDTP